MKKGLHLQSYNIDTLIVINQTGKIKTLYTPFCVVCISATKTITVGVRVYVEEVLSNDKDELQYVIFNTIHSYKHFQLIIVY